MPGVNLSKGRKVETAAYHTHKMFSYLMRNSFYGYSAKNRPILRIFARLPLSLSKR